MCDEIMMMMTDLCSEALALLLAPVESSYRSRAFRGKEADQSLQHRADAPADNTSIHEALRGKLPSWLPRLFMIC